MNFSLSIMEYLLSVGIAAAGSLLQGSVGFGLGLLAVPLLLLVEPDFVPGPILLAAFFLNLLVSHREWKGMDFGNMKWVIIGRILGTVAAAMVMVIIARNALSVLLGVLVLMAVGMSAGGFHLPVNTGNLLGAGILSGFMATTSAIGGPPLALIFQREKGGRLRGNLAGVFLVGTVLSISALATIGRFGLHEIILALGLFPGIVVGFLLSNITSKKLDRGYVQPAVLFVSAISAAMVILRNIL